MGTLHHVIQCRGEVTSFTVLFTWPALCVCEEDVGTPLLYQNCKIVTYNAARFVTTRASASN